MEKSFDVVIPLRDKPSLYNDEELRYCLRSIEKYLPSVRDVWIVGQPRDWLSVNWMEATDGGSRFGSAYRKIMKACDNPHISDPFILFNDDFFLLKPLAGLPDYYDGTIQERISTAGGDYLSMLKRSQRFSDGKNYAVHAPVLIKKNIFKTIPKNISYRIAYGARSGNEKVQMKDPKIYEHSDHLNFHQWKQGKTMFSTTDFSFNYILPKMNQMYPEPSRWE